jgi:hypothetical protein
MREGRGAGDKSHQDRTQPREIAVGAFPASWVCVRHLGSTWLLLAIACGACGPSAITSSVELPDGGFVRAADAGTGVVHTSCAASCPGCCLGEVCFTGDDVRGCGRAGQTCQVCGAGATCTDGRCQAPNDPCGGVTAQGRCASATSVEVCEQPTGLGSPQLVTYDCPTGEACQVTGGVAGCQLVGQCRDGAAECADATTLRVCSNGAWIETNCPTQCMQSALGDYCAASDNTRVISGRVLYETRSANGGRTDWAPLHTVPAQGFLISSVHVSGGETQYLDTQVTTATATSSGTFSLRVPASPTADDYVIVYATGTRADGTMSFVVADPRLAGGEQDVDSSIDSPAVWSWSWRANAVADGAVLTITDAKGSGAARVFDYLRYVQGSSDERWSGMSKEPLVVWLGLNTTWSCGACNVAVPTYQFGTRFAAQIFIPGGSDESYWADAVTAHELGHWVMFTFGHAVGEGGRHCVGVPSGPGLAWSEGWATWYSADARQDPIYIDKQGGTMFWIDLSARGSSGSPWPRPVASMGLSQDLYENEVSAMMWNLSATQGLGHAPFDAALASARMTIGDFERGYTRHTWNVNDKCARVQISDTGDSTTCFADFLDELRCGGTSRAQIDAATDPATHYPYPSASPECR